MALFHPLRWSWLTTALFTLMIGVMAATLALPTSAEPPMKTYRILMVLWRGEEDAVQGFRDYFATQRIPVSIMVRDAAGDLAKLPGLLKEAKAIRPDLVVTWGTSVTLALLGPYDAADPNPYLPAAGIPGIFMIVSQPVESRIVPALASSGRNITGTAYLVPEETQLRAARSYFDFDKIGIVYNDKEDNARLSVEALRALAPTLGYTLIERPLPLDRKGNPRADLIEPLVAEIAAAGAQLLYQPPDSFLNVNRDRLTQAALARGLPTLAAGENPVRNSYALMGIINRYYTVGQLTAYKARQILVEGLNPKEIPIEAPKRFSFMINLPVALQLGRYPPMNLLKFAEIIEGDTDIRRP
ncbi:MAG: ABC transporter substrate-binding protein [Candidatus Competibacteraceae bacterium]|nr:ABC transporter substrate-binding protein [Candidatus Competibacteraceae bacterium]